MESPLPFSLSLILFLIFTLIQPSFAILGSKSYDLATNSLLTYQKFGFLSGGSITTTITLSQSASSGALVYLLICNSDAKHSIKSLAKSNNLCQGQAISELMELCMFKQVVFNDIEGITRILPFDDPLFIKTLVGLDNSMGPRPAHNTAIHDTSEPTILNMVTSNGSKQSRLLSQTATLDSSGGDSALDDTDTDDEVTVKSDPAVNNANIDYDDDDDDDADEQQEVLLRRVLNTWIANEDFRQLQYVGVDAESIDSLEYDYYYVTPSILVEYLSNTVNYQVIGEGMYYSLMLNCDNPASVNIDFALINPDDEHLSTGDIEYKALYCALIVCWTLIFGFWVATWILNKYRKQKTYPLHYFFLVTGFCCFALSIIQEIYWNKYSDSGHSTLALRIMSALLGGLASSLFLTLFLLIGKGYTYINLEMTVRDILDLVIFSVLRFILSWMKEFFGKNMIIVICLVILYTFAFFIIRSDFHKNQKKITSLINSLQSPPPRPSSRNLSTRPSTTFSAPTSGPGPQEEVVLYEENANVLDQAYIDGVTTPQQVVIPSSLNDASEQAREVVRNFDRDVKMLAKKVQLVKWLELMILGHIILICIGEIVCVAAFMDKPFVLDLWSQFLFLVMFFLFTWFFNLKHKYAFIYSNIKNVQDALNQKDLEAEAKTGSRYLDVADLYKISGNFVIVENAIGSDIRLASNMAKLTQEAPPKLNINNEEDAKASLKAKLKKNAQDKKLQQQSLKTQQKASKYRIPSTIQFQYPNIELDSPKIYIPNPSHYEKHVSPHEISLHFVNDQRQLQKNIDEFKIISNSQNKPSISEIKSSEKQYPRPKVAKPVDYRTPVKNSSFYY